MNRKIWENLISLYGVQAFSYLTPLLTLPYLARVLGPSEWGTLAFAEAYGRYVALVIDYGFSLSASREIARVRDNRLALSYELCSVLAAQCLLGLATVSSTIVLTLFVAVFSANSHLLAGATLWGLSTAAVPMWYFFGLERMRIISILNILGNAAASAGVFALVHGPGDSWIPLLLRAMAMIACAVIGLAIAFREVPFMFPSRRAVWEVLRDGGSVFLARSAISLYSTANVLILGLFAAPAVVAWFAGAEKIAKAAVMTAGPLTQSFYPRINYLVATNPAAAKKTMRMAAYLTIGLGIVTGATLFMGAPFIVTILLGSAYENSVVCLRLFAVLPVVIGAANVLSFQWMLPLRLDRQMSRCILFGGVVNLILAGLLARPYQQTGMTVSVVLAEVSVTVAMLATYLRKRRDVWEPALFAEGKEA